MCVSTLTYTKRGGESVQDYLLFSYNIYQYVILPTVGVNDKYTTNKSKVHRDLMWKPKWEKTTK